MPNQLAIQVPPPTVRLMPTLVGTRPGMNIVLTVQEKSNHFGLKETHQALIQPTVRTKRLQSTQTLRWGHLNISTTLRARKIHEPGRWTLPTQEVESKLRKELLSYTSLGENWDGNGAKVPSQQAVNDALTFLNGRPGDIPPPYPEEGTKGDVGIYWDIRQAQVFAEVTFEGDGTCTYFAVRGVPGAVAEKYGKEDVDVTDPWPDDILRILRSQSLA